LGGYVISTDLHGDHQTSFRRQREAFQGFTVSSATQ
jgi:hypothetical protein